MLKDITPLHRIGFYTVLAECQHILFRGGDGRAASLHDVTHGGMHAQALRCLVDGAVATVFDLRDVAHQLAADLPLTHRADVPGLVLYTLRGRFATRAEFVAAVMSQAKAVKLLQGTLGTPANSAERVAA